MKKTLLILFFNFIALIIKNVKMTSVCESIISKNFQESTIIEEIRNKIDSLVKEEKCVEQLLRNGFYLGTEVLIEEMSKRKIRFKDNLKSSINSISKDMDNLYNKFNFDHTDYQVVSPAFMWAQSLDNIYLLIKFGHRHDAPGCLEIKNKEIYINKNILTFKAYCIQGDVPMKLDLKLDMYDEVIQEESIWAKSSVGRFQITLKKKKSPSFWKNLYRDGSIVPSNMKVWFDMKSKFETELKTYYEAEEDDVLEI